MDGFLNAVPPHLLPFLIATLAFIAVVGTAYAIFHRQMSGQDAAQKRLYQLTGTVAKSGDSGGGPVSETRRKQSIEKALSEMAQRERAKQRAKLTLKMRLNQADLTWSIPGYYIRVAGIGIALIALTVVVIGMKLVFAVPVSLIAALLLMNFYVRTQCAQRMKRFLEEFPNAIDIVTRGVKTGLPLGDCLKAIASEGQEPVRTEFQRIVDDISVGLPIGQALARFTQRVPIMEANFFAVVVTIQSQLGGNLSEALGNLSRVLRERKLMKEKIKAFSSEATSSGAIIASMPVVIGGILSLTSPDYIGLLFSEFAGNIVLGGCALWMTTGVIVMRNMIRFDF